MILNYETPAILAQNVTKSYGGNEVLRGFDLAVNQGEVVCLLGPSGCGKTTFLKCCNHLEQISGGVLRVNNQPVGYREADAELRPVSDKVLARQRQDIGVVFQNFNLFPHMTALENVMSGPHLALGRSRRELRPEAMEMLRRVGLGHRADYYPSQLSGGQQQRVAIARALAMQPKVMLFDEPTSALDAELSGEVLTVMKELATAGMTMLVVTHELSFAQDVADRVALVRDGRVEAVGAYADVVESR